MNDSFRSDAKWNRVKATHHRGMRLVSNVTKVLPNGIMLRIGRQRHLITGFLANREIRAFELERHESFSVVIGDELDCFVQEHNDGMHQINVSLLPVQDASISRFLDGLSLGDEMEALVVDHGTAGAYVRFDNGFVGLIPKGEIPDASTTHPFDKRARIDDRICGRVIKIDRARCHVHISPMAHTWGSNSTRIPDEDSEPRTAEANSKGEDASEPAQDHPEQINKVIGVLDDNEPNLISLAQLIRSWGAEVVQANSLSVFLQRAKEHEFDAVVLDLFVDNQIIIDEILQCIASKELTMPIIFYSAYYSNEVYHKLSLAPDQVVDALLKPLLIPRLRKRLQTLTRAERFETDELFSGDDGEHAFFKKPGSHSEDTGSILNKLFQDATERWPHDHLLLLSKDGDSRDPNLVASRRIDTSKFERLRLQMKYGPIGRVMNQGDVIDYTSCIVPPDSRAIQSLQQCNMVLATPIFAHGMVRYGLFIIRSNSNGFTKNDSRALDRVSLETCNQLERAINMEYIQSSFRQIASASLLAGVTHETGNSVNLLRTTLSGITPIVPRIKQGTLTPADRETLVMAIELLDEESNLIASMVRGILNSMSKTNAWASLGKILKEIQDFVTPQAAFGNTSLEFNDDSIVRHYKFPDTAVRQSVFNVILNAVQHLQSCEMDRQKMICVNASLGKDDDEIIIDITDNGFGVHYEERERVFEPYFSTRDEGTGIGLYLTRAMIESLGGKVCLWRSVRYAGTTFRISLRRMNVEGMGGGPN